MKLEIKFLTSVKSQVSPCDGECLSVCMSSVPEICMLAFF